MAQQPLNVIVKILDNLSNVYVFTTPKQHSGSLQDVLKYGSFLATKARDGEDYLDLTGNPVDSSETSQFNMVKLLKLDTGRDKESFFSYKQKMKIIIPEVKYTRGLVVEPTKNYPHALEKVAQFLKTNSTPPVLPVVEPKKVIAELVKAKEKAKIILPKQKTESKYSDEVLTEWLGSRITALRTLAKDPMMGKLFESFVSRTRNFNYQLASNLIVYMKKHYGIEASKKSVMRFFMELQRLGFGKYTPGPKNKKGWVSPTTMTFTWVNCTAENVSKCALGLNYKGQLLTKMPSRLVMVKPVSKELIDVDVSGDFIPSELLPGISDTADEAQYYCSTCEDADGMYDVVVTETEDSIRYQCTNPNCVNHNTPTTLVGTFRGVPSWVDEYDIDSEEEIPNTDAQTLLDNMKSLGATIPAEVSVKQKVEDIRLWLMNLTETGEKGDTQLAWLTFNKLFNLIK